MKKTIIAVALVAAFATGQATAHSNAPHVDKKPTAAPVDAEQKDFGIAGNPVKASRTVTLSMSDNMRFSPSQINVKQGETVKFVVKNGGKLMHEMVIGTTQELKVHAEMMRKHPGMEHDEPYMAHVSPGKTEEIVWHFNRPGEFSFGCLVAGHFEAGMVGKISVK
ncbi:MAG TPA: cupredoxin family protein [Burkholderiales bacterium]|nr:cupredoxin family protein [Burkholderiales bacterium]